MLKVLAVVLLLAIAQLIPSCGDKGDDQAGGSSQPTVIGWVAEKRTRITQTVPYLIVINQVEYGVPYEFWMQVNVGDLVKLQGDKWTIVRKAGS
jgi:hypothetical protein